MLKLLGFTLKVCALSALILILGNIIQWRGKTLSDQVKSHLSHAESMPAFGRARHIANDFARDTQENVVQPASNTGYRIYNTVKAAENAAREEIAPSERQKLRELIRDLNH